MGIITARMGAYQEIYGSDIAVETLIKDFGGCESPLMRTFAERLTQFTARGTIRAAVEPGTRTLSREVRSEAGTGLYVFTKLRARKTRAANFLMHLSDASSVENFLRSSPPGVFFETFLKNNQSQIEINQFRLLATLRSSCPYAPDRLCCTNEESCVVRHSSRRFLRAI